MPCGRRRYVVPVGADTSSGGFGGPGCGRTLRGVRTTQLEAPPMTAVAVAPTPATATDRGTLTGLAGGDEATWRATVRRYEGLLRATARSVLRNDVDEAVQRTWVLLLRNAVRIKDPQCLPGWLATTARREALAIARAQQRTVPSEDVADRVPPDDGEVGSALMSQELRTALHRAVETLPEMQRVVVRALLRESASYDTLSRELGIPRGSLGPVRGRAVRALRAQLASSLR